MANEELKEANIQKVLEEGFKYLQDNNFTSLNKESVAKLTNLSLRTLHRYFKNNDEMLQKIFLYGYEQVLDQIDNFKKSMEDPLIDSGLEKLLNIIDLRQKFQQQNPNTIRFTVELERYLLINEYNGVFLQQLDSLFKDSIIKIFGEALVQGQKDGSIRSDITLEKSQEIFFFLSCSVTYTRMQIPSTDYKSRAYLTKLLQLNNLNKEILRLIFSNK